MSDSELAQTPEEALIMTRALFKEGHWTQGHMRQDDSYCLVGGIRKACFGTSIAPVRSQTSQMTVYHRALGLLRAELGDPYIESVGRYPIIGVGKLLGWNDRARRTREEVIDLLTSAIERRRGAGGT